MLKQILLTSSGSIVHKIQLIYARSHIYKFIETIHTYEKYRSPCQKVYIWCSAIIIY